MPCAQVGADDAEKIAELSLTIAREERAIADLKAQTAGLERQAAALQAKIDSAGEIQLSVFTLYCECCLLWSCIHPCCSFDACCSLVVVFS